MQSKTTETKKKSDNKSKKRSKKKSRKQEVNSATLKFKIEHLPTRGAYRVVLPLYGEAECNIYAPNAADACLVLESFIYNELEGKDLTYGDGEA